MSREDSLKNDFNCFWNSSFGTSNKDYYSKLSIDDLIRLKKAISCINNIITLRTTLSFVDYLETRDIIPSNIAEEIKNDVQSISVNTNGYDVEYSKNGFKLIAEVKCNIPVGENCFGVAQINSILNDLDGLIRGKKKSKISDTGSYFKFMVLLDTNGVKKAMEKIMNKSTLPLEVLQDTTLGKMKTDRIYVIYI